MGARKGNHIYVLTTNLLLLKTPPNNGHIFSLMAGSSDLYIRVMSLCWQSSQVSISSRLRTCRLCLLLWSMDLMVCQFRGHWGRTPIWHTNFWRARAKGWQKFPLLGTDHGNGYGCCWRCFLPFTCGHYFWVDGPCSYGFLLFVQCCMVDLVSIPCIGNIDVLP